LPFRKQKIWVVTTGKTRGCLVPKKRESRPMLYSGRTVLKKGGKKGLFRSLFARFAPAARQKK